jgi:parvulin-like peptidyl-prolyl isomerase
MNTATRLWVLVLAASAAVGCADLTEPGPSAGKGGEKPTTQGAAPTPTAQTARAAAPAAPPAADDTRIRASHILIAYQGARRSQATRSKEDAKKLAEQLAARAKGGADFADLAKQFSDDAVAKARGGDLGNFGREGMVKPFADAAFALKPTEISGVVETPFGFHIIKRTE